MNKQKRRKQNSLTKKMVFTHNEKREKRKLMRKQNKKVIVLHNDNR